MIHYTLDCDELTATLQVGENGDVFERGALLFTDEGFLDRIVAEKVELIRAGRRRVFRERLRRGCGTRNANGARASDLDSAA